MSSDLVAKSSTSYSIISLSLFSSSISIREMSGIRPLESFFVLFLFVEATVGLCLPYLLFNPLVKSC